MFACEFRETFKNNFFRKTPMVAASVYQSLNAAVFSN